MRDDTRMPRFIGSAAPRQQGQRTIRPAGGTRAELYAPAEDHVLEEQTREEFGFGRALSRA